MMAQFIFHCFCQDVSPGMQRMLLRIENLNSDGQPRKCVTNYIRQDTQVTRQDQETMTQHSTMRGWGIRLQLARTKLKTVTLFLRRKKIRNNLSTCGMTSFNSCSRTYHTCTILSEAFQFPAASLSTHARQRCSLYSLLVVKMNSCILDFFF